MPTCLSCGVILLTYTETHSNTERRRNCISSNSLRVAQLSMLAMRAYCVFIIIICLKHRIRSKSLTMQIGQPGIKACTYSCLKIKRGNKTIYITGIIGLH